VLRAPLVIAAHGSWEVLPSDRPQQRLARHPSDLFAFKANFAGSSLGTGLLPVLTFDGGYGGMVVADGGLMTLACCIRADRLEAVRRASPGVRAGDAIEALLKRECLGVRQALVDSTRDGAWLAAGPLAPGIRVRADDGLFRIGNAAGEAHPILGEGISMALQSAWLLCTHLLEPGRPGRAAAPALQRDVARRYATEWRRRFAPRLRLAAAFAHVAMRPRLAAPLISLAEHWPGLLTFGARRGGKVTCAIEASSIAQALARTSASAAPGIETVFRAHATPPRTQPQPRPHTTRT
jgi:flavin-dependent dehydrogenase